MAEQFPTKNNLDQKTKQNEIQHVFKTIVECAEENNKRLGDSHKFEPYWNYNDVQHGLKKKILHQGILHVTLNKTENAYVTPPCCILGKEDIHIIGLKSRNRAFEGDRVVVKIFNTKNWVKDATKKEGIKPTGRVVFILEYNHARTSLGFIEKLNIDKPMACLGFQALDPSVPPALITQEFLDWQRKQEDSSPFGSMFYVQAQFLQSLLYSAKIESWPVFNVARAKLIDVISEHGASVPRDKLVPLLEREVTSLINQLGFPRDNYEAKRHRAIQRYFSRLYETKTYISKEDLANRTDLTEQVAFTLSPHERTADDVCVAFSCVPQQEDLSEVQVHVADVASYLCAGGVMVGQGATVPKKKQQQQGKPVNHTMLNILKLMNKQAEEVCVSVATINRRVSTLLPPALRKICSLTPGEKKLALTFAFVVDASGNIKSRRVFASLIQSTVHLTYAAFKKILADPAGSDLGWVSQEAAQVRGGKHKTPPPLDPAQLTSLQLAISQLWSRKLAQTRPPLLRVPRPRVQFTILQNVPRRVHVDYGLSEVDDLISYWLQQVDLAAGTRVARAFPASALLVRQASPDQRLAGVLRDFLNQRLGLDGAGEDGQVPKGELDNSDLSRSKTTGHEENQEETSSSEDERGDPSKTENERNEPSESEGKGQLARSLAKALQRARTLDPDNQNLVPVLLVLLDKIMHEPELCTLFRAESTHHFSRNHHHVAQLTSPLHHFSHILSQKQLLMSLNISKNHEYIDSAYINYIANKHNGFCSKLIRLEERVSEIYLAMQLGYIDKALYCQAIVVATYENSVEVLVPSLYFVHTLYLDNHQVSTSMEGGLWVHQVKWKSPAHTLKLAHLSVIPVTFRKVEYSFRVEVTLRHPLGQESEGLITVVQPQGATDEPLDPAHRDFISRHHISLSQIESLLNPSESNEAKRVTPATTKTGISAPLATVNSPSVTGKPGISAPLATVNSPSVTGKPGISAPLATVNSPSVTSKVSVASPGTPGKPAPLVTNEPAPPAPASAEKPKRARKKKNKKNQEEGDQSAKRDGPGAAKSSWFHPSSGHAQGAVPTSQPSRIAELLSSEIEQLTIVSSEEGSDESGSESNENQQGDTNGAATKDSRPSLGPEPSVGASEASSLTVKESRIKGSPSKEKAPIIPLDAPVRESATSSNQQSPTRCADSSDVPKNTTRTGYFVRPILPPPTSSNVVSPTKHSPSGSNLPIQQSSITQTVTPITDRGVSPVVVPRHPTPAPAGKYNPLLLSEANQPGTTPNIPSPSRPANVGVTSFNTAGGVTSSDVARIVTTSSVPSLSRPAGGVAARMVATSSVPSPTRQTSVGVTSLNTAGVTLSTSSVPSPIRPTTVGASTGPTLSARVTSSNISRSPSSASSSSTSTPVASSPHAGSPGSRPRKKEECLVS